ncbi:Sulphur transport [Octadecabacter temperatus]|uniref:Putative inner membrane protein n=1 Tax=Octadecabacter temperatus TaxID=1458307 RepID=A0A0K0Y4G1_9RHOB|nr:YeeE/YedE family protein [Octadecabacter temperatus]AKS45883.1 putative inner membrane protein [Octadecabacter temperatus]SIO02719.1 Sulphur transport [Octadecabacter temperatus]
MENLLETYGEGTVLFALGGIVGLVFGAAAYQSKFCLRAATIEVAQGRFGSRLSIWLIAFCAAVFGVQFSIAMGWLSVADARQLANVGSLSGAIIGGLMFGIGMVLARGCASRLLVLSGTGNLRALVTGLVLTVVAQASLSGVLAPARIYLSGLWSIQGGSARDMLALIGLNATGAATLAGICFVGALIFAARKQVPVSQYGAAVIVGLAVAGGWVGTYQIAQASFEVVSITSVTFTGPSADTLMALVTEPSVPMGFGLGLVPGVFIGAATAAALTSGLRIQRFGQDTPMERYLIGAFLMGFGSMLAGGCAVGAGMSGGAIFSLTAWVAVGCMWIGAMGAQLVLEKPQVVAA